MSIVYKCSKCGLKFASPGIVSVLKYNKCCVKCSTFFASKPADTPLNLPKHNISLDNKHKTCMRCGVTVKRNMDVCPVCSCTEYIS